jgi:hypothetical protein
MPPPRYPSDLSNEEEWAILEPLLSRVEGRGDRPSGLHAGSRTPFSTCSEERLLVAHAPTRVPTLADGVLPFFSAGGGSTAGSEERMTGCAKRCAKRRDATGTLALR